MCQTSVCWKIVYSVETERQPCLVRFCDFLSFILYNNMNLKKLFASVAGVSLLATTLFSPAAFGATNYGAELEGAYAYAYGVGATTQYPIENANIYGAITRAELAKVISNWAEKVLGLAPDTSAACSFSDIASLKGSDLYDAVIRSCQLGLMGQGITAFRPYDTVTRAEFGTILSRALWGDKYDGGTPYYAAHLNALKAEGIMTMINDPSMKEIRGYVFIMLQRVDEDYLDGSRKPAVCRDPLIMLACALETDDCPAECKEKEEKPVDPADRIGDLNVRVADYSSTIKTAPMVGTVVFNSIEFTASQSITINSIQLERIGLSSRADIKGVWFEKDGKAVSSAGKVTSDGKVTVNFTRGFTVKAKETLDLVVELNGANAGSQVAFRLLDAVSSAANVNVKGDTTTYQTVNYKVAEAAFTAVDGYNATYKLGSQSTYTLGEFKIENVYDTTAKEDKPIVVKNLLLNNAEGIDLQGLLQNVKVYRDGKVVSKYVTLEGRDMTIAFDNDVIDGGRTATYTIIGEIGALERVPSKVKLQIKKGGDLVVEEQATKFRATVSATANDASSLYTIEGGRIRLVNDDSLPTSVDAGTGSSNVVIAKGTIEVAEPVLLNDLIITVAQGSGVLKNLSVEIGGSRYGLDQSTDGSKWSIEEIVVNKNSSFRLLADLNTNPIPASSTVEVSNITSTSFGTPGTTKVEFLNNGEFMNADEAIAGLIKTARINVRTPQFSLEETSSLTTQRVVVGDAATRTIFEGTLSAKRGDVTGRSITISGASNPITPANTRLALTVFIDGVAYPCGTETTNFTSCSITQGLGTIGATAKKIKVEAYLDATNPSATGAWTFDIVAEGRLDGNDTKSNVATTVQLMVAGKATINVSNAGTANTIAIAGTNRTLAAFDINVTNGFVNLEKLALTFATSMSSLNNPRRRLFINGEEQQANALLNTGGTGLTFDAFDYYAQEGRHRVELRANIPFASAEQEVALTKYKINNEPEGNLSLKYLFVRAYPMITVKSTSTDRNEMILSITNTFDGIITLDQIVATNVAGASIAGNRVTITEANTPQYGTFSPVTLAKGDTVELTMNVNAGKTMTLDGLVYTMNEGETRGVETYEISDVYADPIKWGNFRLAGK